jgi:hypothetical protein
MRSPELGQRSLFDASPPVTTVQARTSYRWVGRPTTRIGPKRVNPTMSSSTRTAPAAPSVAGFTCRTAAQADKAKWAGQ